MRKDVNRSLMTWPFVASVLATGLCYVLMHHGADIFQQLAWLQNGESAGRSSLAASGTDADRFDGSLSIREASGPFADGPYPSATIGRHELIAGHDGVMPLDLSRFYGGQSRVAGDPDAERLKGIASWLKTPQGTQSHRPDWVAAPVLNTQTDLFGFDIEAATRSIAAPDAVVEEQASTSIESVINIDVRSLFAQSEPAQETRGATFNGVLQNEQAARFLPGLAGSVTRLPQLDNLPLPTMPQAFPGETAGYALQPANASGNSDPALLAEVETLNPPIEIPGLGAQLALNHAASKDMSQAPRAADTVGVNLPYGVTSERGDAWVTPTQLIQQLDVLDRISGDAFLSSSQTFIYSLPEQQPSVDNETIKQWSRDVRFMLDQMGQIDSLSDPAMHAILYGLEQMTRYGWRHVESLPSRSQRVAWTQATYSLQRRLMVWRPVYQLISSARQSPDGTLTEEQQREIRESIAEIRALHATFPDRQQWLDYLVIEDLQRAVDSNEPARLREVGQIFLARLVWPNLQPEQKEWLASPVFQQAAELVGGFAADPIDYSALLEQIERCEQNSIDLVTAEIAHTLQMLSHSPHPNSSQLASNLDTYYRNANIRFSVSEELLNHVLPAIEPRKMDFNGQLAGMQVTGTSEMHSQFSLDLKDCRDGWDVHFQAMGYVGGKHESQHPLAAVNTLHHSPFETATPLSIRRQDVLLGPTALKVDSDLQLEGVQTSYQQWPLVHELVTMIVAEQYRQQHDALRQESEQQLKATLESGLQTELGNTVEQVSSRLSETVLGPLQRLRLAPQVTDMQSTEDRLIARYRVAGDLQLAAMTPRPRAVADNLISVQVHQSALNNMMEQLLPQGEEMSAKQLLETCYQSLGLATAQMPNNLPEDVRINLANHRPVTIEIEDGKFWITLRVIRLKKQQAGELRNVIVRACYMPQIHGLDIKLIRQGHLSLSGPGMSLGHRLPARALFNKLLPHDQPLQLTNPERLAARLPAGTRIGQFELRDGWIGIAVTPEDTEIATTRRPIGIR
jgi:hypothetical protein